MKFEKLIKERYSCRKFKDKAVEPVSYTHLDVYKRQVSFLPLPNFWLLVFAQVFPSLAEPRKSKRCQDITF